MTIGILGKKLGMTQLFQKDGSVVPVTVVQAGPCKVLQVKVKEAAELAEGHRQSTTNLGHKRGKVARPRRGDGYYAVQLGFDDYAMPVAKPAKDTRRHSDPVSKPAIGHAAKVGSAPKRFVREIRLATAAPYQPGDDLTVEAFADVKWVDVTGTSKGKGFAGTIKRWGFHRQPMSHGNSKHHRKPGGLGRQNSISKGVPKGKKMGGHLGVERVTIQNLELVKVDSQRNLLFIRGAIPGHRDAYVIVRDTLKAHRAKVVPQAKTKKAKKPE